MQRTQDIVITGLGIASPIGVGQEPFWDALVQGRSGIRALDGIPGSDGRPLSGGAIVDFDPNRFVPRKQKKVMSRDIQLGFAAADMACREAGIKPGAVDPERLGVLYGADMIFADLPELREAFQNCTSEGRFDFGLWGARGMGAMFPLWMLKYLPNMPACHIAIAQDARGPNNTLTMAEVSGLAAIGEAVEVIRRGQADVMIAGAASSRLHPCAWLRFQTYQFSRSSGDPAAACRPFDAGRDGMVLGEGAAAFILETRAHAERRGAKPLARIGSVVTRFEPRPRGAAATGRSIGQAIAAALEAADLRPADVGHVNAHGLSTVLDDRIEARAIRDALGDVPVTAPKSYFGNLVAATGAVEAAASALAIHKGAVPPTLNYENPDPECPVRVVAKGPVPLGPPTALVLNHTPTGQAAAMVLARVE